MTATATQTVPLDVALRQAVAHHQAGRLQEAEQLYRAILQAQPYQPDANHNLGVLAGQVGQHAAALPFLKTALSMNPAHGQYSLSYAGALLTNGQAGEALNILQAAEQRGFNTPAAQTLRHKAEMAAQSAAPTLAETNRLVALFNAGRYGELENLAYSLLERHPDSGFIWKGLGISLRLQGKGEASLPALRKALELLPGDAEGHNNLGNALRDLGQLDDAVASYQKALEIKPDFPDVLFNLGNVYQNLEQYADAAACYQKTLTLEPGNAEAHNNLGNALRELGKFDDAVASHQIALEIEPDNAEAHNNLGNVLLGLGKLVDSAASYQRALTLEPDNAKIYNNLGNILHLLGRFDEALANYKMVLAIKPDDTEARSNLLFTYNFLAGLPSSEMLAEARRYGEQVQQLSRPYAVWHNAPDPARSLRVGLVSGDLRSHPVGWFLESVLAETAAHTSGLIELIAYANNSRTDALTERIKSRCHSWHSVAGLSDSNLAQLIRDDGIDILIDLSGHTAKTRLPMFAWKPAPIQVSWLGYFATTGVAAMDYIIADSWTVPKSEESHFTEKIQRLPETYLCYTPPDADVPVAPLPALVNGTITFGCFNNIAKMNDAVVALWARLLTEAPGSRLFLKTAQLDEAAVRQSVVNRFATHGIAAERLIMEGAAPRTELLAAYHRVDIALDPFPYPGGATSIEALWMGVPVLTLMGDRFLSHIGESILQNAGLPEWVAIDVDDYVARAVSHTRDLQRLATLHNGLRQQVLASPLFDAPRFARHFEAALRVMWREWCASRVAQQ